MKTTFLALVACSIQMYRVSANPIAAREDNSTLTSPLCNIPGWDAGTESFNSLNAGGYTGCSQACYADSQCKSFAFLLVDPGEPDCQLYTTVMQDNFAEDSNSPWVFYDAVCQATSNICGVPGYYINIWAYSLSDTYNHPERQNVKWCYEWCLSWGDYCQSFGWDPYHCYLYNVPATGNVQADPQNVGGARTFYDVGCATLKAMESTSTSMTSTMTTATSKNAASTTTTVKSSIKVATSTSAEASVVSTTTAIRTSNTTFSSTTTVKQSSTITSKAPSSSSAAAAAVCQVHPKTTSTVTKT